MNKTSRKRPRRQNLYSPQKTSTLKLPWPWIVPAAAAHHAASAFFFCPKVKRCQRCQRIRVKSYQNVGFRSSIDYNFSRQPGLVTTHSHLGVFLDQTVKVGRQSIETNRPWRQAMWGPTGTANSVQRREKRIKTSGLRVLVDYVRPLRELTHFWTSTCGGTIYPAYGGKNEAVN